MKRTATYTGKYIPFLLIILLIIVSACTSTATTAPTQTTTSTTAGTQTTTSTTVAAQASASAAANSQSPASSNSSSTSTSTLSASSLATIPISAVVPEDSMFAYFLSNGNLTIFATALQMTNVLPELAGKGPYTVFVPTNEAFIKLPPVTFKALFDDTAKLKELILYHIVQGEYSVSELTPPMSLKTLQGEEIKVILFNYDILINDAQFVQAEIPGKNGVGHIIDKVLFPPSFGNLISPSGSVTLPSLPVTKTPFPLLK